MRMNQTEFEVETKKNEIFVRNLLDEGGYSDERIAKLVGISVDEAARIRHKVESEGK